MNRKFTLLLFFWVLVVTVAIGQTKKHLTNDDIMEMTKAGSDETTVIRAIQANEASFDTSQVGLVALRTAGVTKPIIDTIFKVEAAKKPVTFAPVAVIPSRAPDTPGEAGAQQSGGQQAWGTSNSPTASAMIPATVADPSASMVFFNAQFQSAGTGLRNRAGEAISVSGIVTPVKAALIYWAVITQGAPSAANQVVWVERLYPDPRSFIAKVVGSVVGSGASPCWGGDRITVYRGFIPTSLVTSDGLFRITLSHGASGSVSGADPWAGATLPLMEGASIVVVSTIPQRSAVAIYDTGLAGATFDSYSGINYSLSLPVAAAGTFTLFGNIGADGQTGGSVTAADGTANEWTFINGLTVAGPGSPNNDSDWNGSSGQPLPQLWDDTVHNITAATPSGTTVLNVTIYSPGPSTGSDCLTPVANIVQVQY